MKRRRKKRSSDGFAPSGVGRDEWFRIVHAPRSPAEQEISEEPAAAVRRRLDAAHIAVSRRVEAARIAAERLEGGR